MRSIKAIGVGAAAAVAVSVAAASPAVASPSDSGLVYLQMLNNDNIVIDNAAAAIANGYAMCKQIARGYTPVQVATWLWQSIPSYTQRDAANDFVDAVYALCPEYGYTLNSPTESAYGPSQVL